MSAATASLCLVAVTHTYLLFHCFPYIGYMAVSLQQQNSSPSSTNSVTVDSVGWLAGLLGTAFTTGRCLSFVPWKIMRHRHTSNKHSLLLSLLLSSICSIWFGLSTTYWSALTARFCLGLSNTLSGCVKRIAIDKEKMQAARKYKAANEVQGQEVGSETKQDESVTGRVLAAMWWGSAIGPLLGGMLSNPGTFSRGTPLPDIVEQRYPFLLPNIVAAILCVISMLAILVFVANDNNNDDTDLVVHTTTSNAANTNPADAEPCGENRPLLLKQSTSHDNNAMLGRGPIETFQLYWRDKNTRFHLIAYWSFSFAVVCFDEALPLYLIARAAGPGLSPRQIGWILCLGGLTVVISQSFGLERILSEQDHGIGLYPSLRLASIMANLPSVLVPFMLVLNGGTYYYMTTTNGDEEDSRLLSEPSEESLLGEAGHLKWSSFVFIAIISGCGHMFCSMYFSLIGVATGRTVPPSRRDEVARVMTLGALGVRAIAPVFAGALVSVFMSSSFDGAAVALWSVIGLVVGLGAALFTFQLTGNAEGSSSTTEKSKRQNMYLKNRQGSQLFSKLWGARDNRGSATLGAKWRRFLCNRMTTPSKITGDYEKDEDMGNINRNSTKRMSWADGILRPGMQPDKTPFFILGTHKDDKACLPHVLTPPLMESLQTDLPMACSQDNFYLKYSLVRDGASFLSLESRLSISKNTIIAIETLQGDVFGCFMAKPWQKSHKYEMSGESFLWRLKDRRSIPEEDDQSSLPTETMLDEIARKEGNVDIFKWTGENEECQLFSNDRIAAGGGIVDGHEDGFGFIVEDDLSKGTSGPCATYGNPCLVAALDGRFEIANMEVWSMTPFLFASDVEKSETTLRFLDENMAPSSNAHGDAPSSAQSEWTNFF